MGAEDTGPTLDMAYALRPSLSAPPPQHQSVFWLALLAAALVHAALVVGVYRSQPRYLGDPGGSAAAIDVELVDASELRSTGAPASQVATPPPTPAPAAPADTAPAEPPRREPAPETSPPPKAAALPALETEEPQVSPQAVPKTPPKAVEPAKKESAEPEPKPKPTAKVAPKPPDQLDLSVPFDLTMQGAASAGGASSATRPPGITRSGENDRFGRDVIRALKKTMPPNEGVTGKVTIRIFLNERGNIDKLQLTQGSGDRILDDSVLFSAYQTSFPFPPKGATVADRTFLVTYVYR